MNETVNDVLVLALANAKRQRKYARLDVQECVHELKKKTDWLAACDERVEELTKGLEERA